LQIEAVAQLRAPLRQQRMKDFCLTDVGFALRQGSQSPASYHGRTVNRPPTICMPNG
jgi:hypothetical protein